MLLLATDQMRYANWIEKRAPFANDLISRIRIEDRQESSDYALRGTDAVIQVIGPLSYKFDIWTWIFGGSSYQGIMSQLDAANGDDSVERIIMIFDTPGGEVTGLKEMATAIAGSPKEVVAFVDPLCASAGLYMASQCSRIVGVPSSEIGSLGCQCMLVSIFEMYKEAGVDIEVIRAAIGPKKNLGHPYEPISDEARAEFQSRADAKGEEFLAAVADGRGVSIDEARKRFGQGRMMFVEEALDVGLFDSVMSLSELLAEKRRTKNRLGAQISRFRPRI